MLDLNRIDVEEIATALADQTDYGRVGRCTIVELQRSEAGLNPIRRRDLRQRLGGYLGLLCAHRETPWN